MKKYLFIIIFLSSISAFAGGKESSDSMSELIFTITLGVFGFLGKSVWDIGSKLYIDTRTAKISIIEKQLTNFYWPLYLRLEKDSVVWGKILDRKDSEKSFEYQFSQTIEKNVIIPNHMEMVKIIENNIHLAGNDQLLLEQLKIYLDHVVVFKSLRDAGNEKLFPYDLGVSWPKDLFTIVKEKTTNLQSKYDKLRKLN